MTPRYLLPASRPGKPRGARATRKLLRQHGLPTLAARNTAMIEAVGELPPIAIADLFGIRPGTAQSWAKFAQVKNGSWSRLLFSRRVPSALLLGLVEIGELAFQLSHTPECGVGLVL